tara:strand:- start:1165 stop:2109 length:945 start_codon:yes stop_codon:yes gene_type:complete
MYSDFEASIKQINMVKEFYEKHPFPPNSIELNKPKDFKWYLSIEAVNNFFNRSCHVGSGRSHSLFILDAGCGTGLSTNYLAHQNRDSQIHAIDISRSSLEIAQKRIVYSGADKKANVTFENINFLDMENFNKFNFINSIGVIQHLKNPLEGFLKINFLLADNGIAHIYLYAKRGRENLNRIKQIFRLMELDSNIESINICRDFLDSLPINNPIQIEYEDRWKEFCKSDINFADLFLHPYQNEFTITSIFSLIKQSGLEFLGFRNTDFWNLGRILDKDFLAIAKKLSTIDQYRLIELLDPSISSFEFFLTKKHQN